MGRYLRHGSHDHESGSDIKGIASRILMVRCSEGVDAAAHDFSCCTSVPVEDLVSCKTC